MTNKRCISLTKKQKILALTLIAKSPLSVSIEIRRCGAPLLAIDAALRSAVVERFVCNGEGEDARVAFTGH